MIVPSLHRRPSLYPGPSLHPEGFWSFGRNPLIQDESWRPSRSIRHPVCHRWMSQVYRGTSPSPGQAFII